MKVVKETKMNNKKKNKEATKLNEHAVLKPKRVMQAVSIINQLNEKFYDKSHKQPLLDDIHQKNIFLQISMKKVPPQNAQKFIKVPLPNTLVNQSTEVCFIAGDTDKKDTKADVEEDILKYKEYFKKQGVTQISEIMTLRQLRKEYKPYEAKRKLAAAYEVFLCDKKIAGVLPSLLGKKFFVKRRLPIQIDLKSPNVKEQIDKALSSTVFHVSCRGNSCTSEVANLSMKKEEILANVKAALDILIQQLPGKLDNIMGIYLKSDKSKAIPLYMSFDAAKGIDFKTNRKKGAIEAEELSTMPNALVKVLHDGRIVVQKAKEGEDDDDSMSDDGEDFLPIKKQEASESDEDGESDEDKENEGDNAEDTPEETKTEYKKLKTVAEMKENGDGESQAKLKRKRKRNKTSNGGNNEDMSQYGSRFMAGDEEENVNVTKSKSKQKKDKKSKNKIGTEEMVEDIKSGFDNEEPEDDNELTVNAKRKRNRKGKSKENYDEEIVEIDNSVLNIVEVDEEGNGDDISARKKSKQKTGKKSKKDTKEISEKNISVLNTAEDDGELKEENNDENSEKLNSKKRRKSKSTKNIMESQNISIEEIGNSQQKNKKKIHKEIFISESIPIMDLKSKKMKTKTNHNEEEKSVEVESKPQKIEIDIEQEQEVVAKQKRRKFQNKEMIKVDSNKVETTPVNLKKQKRTQEAMEEEESKQEFEPSKTKKLKRKSNMIESEKETNEDLQESEIQVNKEESKEDSQIGSKMTKKFKKGAKETSLNEESFEGLFAVKKSRKSEGEVKSKKSLSLKRRQSHI